MIKMIGIHFILLLLFLAGITLLSPSPVYAAESPESEPAAASGVHEDKQPGQAETPPSSEPKTIQERIDALRKEVEKMQKEDEARKKLRITEAEKDEKEKDILSSAGRRYTMMRAGTMGIVYGFNYEYNNSSTFRDNSPLQYNYHNVTNSISTEYALLDNVTLIAAVPFVYKYDKVETESARSVTDMGDASFSVSMQPIKAGGNFPSAILNAGFIFPTGSSPYEGALGDLSTGSGLYSMSLGTSLSKSVDPVVAFGSLSYQHSLKKSGLNQNWGGKILEEVVPGDTLGIGIGMGIGIAYQVYASISYSYSYGFGTQYNYRSAPSQKTGTDISSSINIGTSWRLAKRTVTMGFGIGLTGDGSDVTFSFSIPFEFGLK
jgi:TolA-binding protein